MVSFRYITIGLYSTIQNLSPLITVITANLVLNESLKRYEIVNIIISFGGVLLIVFFTQKHRVKEIHVPASVGMDTFAVFLCVLSATLVGVKYVMVRSLRYIHFSIFNAINGYCLLLVSTILWLIYRPIMGNMVSYEMTNEQWVYLILAGMLYTTSNQSIIAAISSDKVGRVASLHFLLIVLGYAGDTLMFGYSLNIIEFIGALTIIVSTAITFLMRYFKRPD